MEVLLISWPEPASSCWLDGFSKWLSSHLWTLVLKVEQRHYHIGLGAVISPSCMERFLHGAVFCPL